MTNINDVIANELVRRVRKLSTDELLALAKNGVAEKRSTRPSSRSGVHRLALPSVGGERPSLTIAEAILKATASAKKALSTGEIVAETVRLRPDAQEATIRAEISKLTSTGVLLRHGPRIGGTYEAGETTGKMVANG